MQRTSEDLEDRLDVSELIERISVERGLPVETTGRHRLLLDPDARRSSTRRLAPAIAGVTTVLVATTVAVTLRTGDTPAGPDLDAALVGAASADPTTIPDPAAEEVPAPDETSTAADESQTATPTTTRAAALARKPAQPVANDGTQAATTQGWKLIGRDEFAGSTLSDRWSPYDGPGNDGEVDFAETTSASDSVSFFLHHGSGDQKVAEKQIDLTQWHNYAVEVTSEGVFGYVDGQKWFESTDPDTLPRGPVHPVIQLDWFPKGDSPEPSELQVDWMRIYE